MRRQLRPFHSAERLAEIYHHPYDHTRWPEHRQRVDWTIRAGVVIAEHRRAGSLVDLSCGDGAVLRGIQSGVKHSVELTFGDLVAAAHVQVIGPIEETIMDFTPAFRPSRMLVLTETIEHLENPDEILKLARWGFDTLLVTTPIAETEAHGNEEHYWSWDVEDLAEMLHDSGWDSFHYSRLDATFYNYQLWGCR